MASTQRNVQNPQQYNILHVYMSDAAGNRLPGVRVVEPAGDSSQAIRGNLYAVVEVFGADEEALNVEMGRITERLLGVIQSTYYSAKGSQSQVLTSAIQNAHQFLQENNSNQPADKALRASTMCVSFLNGRMMLASSGPALALLVTEQAVEQFPSQAEQESAQLGGAAAPILKIIQHDVHSGGAFYVGSSRLLNHIPIRTLLGSLTRTTAQNIDEVASYLNQESNYVSIPGMLLSIEPTSPTASSGGDGRPRGGASAAGSSNATSPQGPTADAASFQAAAEDAPAAGSARHAASGSLPTSVFASPPVHTAPPADDQAADSASWTSPTSRPSPQTQSRAYSYADDRATTPESAPVTDSESRAAWAADERDLDGDDNWDGSEDDKGNGWGESPRDRTVSEVANRTGFGTVESSTVSPSPIAPSMEQLGDRVRQQWAQARKSISQALNAVLPGNPPGQVMQNAANQPDTRGESRLVSPATPAGREARSRFDAAASAAGAGAERLAQASANMTKAAVTGAAETANQFEPPAPASGSRARMFASIAILIVLLTPILVAAVMWQRGASSRAEGEQRYEEARSRYLSASSALDTGDKTAARTELTAAQNSLQVAQMLLGNQPKITVLAQEIQTELQEVLLVWPLYKLVEPLVRFPADAQPRRVLVVDQDIYILDGGRDLIQRFRLDADRELIEDEAGEIVLRRGDVIAGQSVTDLIDMTWQAPIPGIEDKANLLVLDSSNHVFRYNQRVEGAGILPFFGQEKWQSPSQIEVYLGRVYVADGVSGQVFRYTPVEPGAYMEEPQPWLLTPAPNGLAGVQAMTIDGDIWLLFGDSSLDSKLLRYNQGQQVPFALDNAVGLITDPVDLFVGVQENSFLYIADAGEERILVYNKDGSYKRQLQAAEGNPLRDLSGIFVDDTTQTLYILTQSALYQHPLPE